MAYGNESLSGVLTVLSDPTRRAVLESVRGRPRAVVDIAEELPVSRPAVSQHLKRLKEAGLVVDRSEGARRLYAARPEGLEPLRDYLDTMWTDVLGAFESFMRRESSDERTPR